MEAPPPKSNPKKANLAAALSNQRRALADPAYVLDEDSLRPDTLEKADRFKVERNAIASYFIARAFVRSRRNREQRAPYGLLLYKESAALLQQLPFLEDRSEMYPFNFSAIPLMRSIVNTLSHDLHAELEEVRGED